MKSKKTDYIFNIRLEDCGACDVGENILRKIRIPGDKSLYHFAEMIIRAFGFDFDHCFGFYDNFKRHHDSERAYELLLDIGEEPLTPTVKSVKKTKIAQTFQSPGEKMLFLFDYGDEWRFSVELKEIKTGGKGSLKPVVLESIGKAPEQYPPCEED